MRSQTRTPTDRQRRKRYSNGGIRLQLDWHTYRVEVKGNEVTFFIDGTAVSYADSTRTSILSNGPITLGSAMIELHIGILSITAL